MPTEGDLYGIGPPIVVSGWESQLHGEGEEVVRLRGTEGETRDA